MALHHLWHVFLGSLLGIKFHLSGIPEGLSLSLLSLLSLLLFLGSNLLWECL